jgi:hypothetical protein
MLNMAVLGIGVIAIPIGFIGNFLFNLGSLFQEYFVFIGFVSAVIFTNMTFYKGWRKKALIVLIFVIILGIIQIILYTVIKDILITRDIYYYLRVSLDLPYTLLVYNWFAYSFYSAYNRLKNQNIEPWIKLRYKMLAFASLFMSFHSIPEFFLPEDVLWGDPNNLASLVIFGTLAIMAIIYGIIFSWMWFMPKWFRNYLNRTHKREPDKEYTEEELMNLIKDQLDNQS